MVPTGTESMAKPHSMHSAYTSMSRTGKSDAHVEVSHGYLDAWTSELQLEIRRQAEKHYRYSYNAPPSQLHSLLLTLA